MAGVRAYKSSTGYFLNLGKEVTVFFDEWEIPEPDSTELGEWEPHINLTLNNCSVALIYGRKMKEVQAALNRMKRDSNN